MTILDELYPETPIPLEHRDPFSLLVAVVLSAQTTDKKVNQVTPRLFALAPTPAKMAGLSEAEIRDVIREIGLAPQKARSLKRMSEMLAERGGEVPQTFEELEALPGVGHKTASVVMAQAFGHPAFPVDTHIHRLARRWGLSDGSSVARTERDLKRTFPEESWNKLHLQIIYFGRGHCPALYHDLEACPICSWAASGKLKAAERRNNQERRTRRNRDSSE
jgi:endonuclease-3